LGESGQGANLPSVTPRPSPPAPDALVRITAIISPPKGPFFKGLLFSAQAY
jgi:hypothetical protein